METQSEAQKALQNSQSLNRTMQYGNPVEFIVHISYFVCLNRTMQYGNKIGKIFFLKSEYSLNRTMQYGNDGQSST